MAGRWPGAVWAKRQIEATAAASAPPDQPAAATGAGIAAGRVMRPRLMRRTGWRWRSTRSASRVASTTMLPSLDSCPKQMHDAARELVVDMAGRLVAQQEARPCDHGARHRDQLALRHGQVARRRILELGQPQPAHHLGHDPADLRILAAVDAQRQRDVVERRQVIEQAEVLEDHADAPAQGAKLARPELGDVAVEQAVAAGRGIRARPKSRRSEVLPAALGPIRNTKPPGCKARSTSCRTSRPGP